MILIVFLPLLGFLTVALFGRFLGVKGSTLVTTSLLGLAFLCSVYTFITVSFSNEIYVFELGTWMQSGLFNVQWAFLFDTVTCVMLVVVTSISFLVHFYSLEYMNGDPHMPRFFSYLSLFTFFMLILVTGNSLIQLFVGWEGVGLCSFLLINFWHTRYQANKAAIKAMTVNRIGDVGLTIGIILVFYFFGTINFSEFLSMGEVFHELNTIYFSGIAFNAFELIALFVFIGAVGKSAQVGLHTWLPDAMEGPTPVSALIHAATMVTAGVFALVRMSNILVLAPVMMQVITVVGALTAFFAATTGIFQNDLKRVIAYSTCSQLGYMVFACGLGNFSLAMFHLANHAFFKALLFLTAGSVIHALADEQDMRKMGGLVNVLPITYIMMLTGSLALTGFPFLTGFYSKDVILEIASVPSTNVAMFAYVLGILSAFCTAFYSARSLYMTFLAPTNAYRNNLAHAHEPQIFMMLPLFILVVGSVFVGFLGKDFFIGMASSFWGAALAQPTITSLNTAFEAEFIPVYIKHIPFVLSLAGMFLSFYFYSVAGKFSMGLLQSSIMKFVFAFFNKKWLFDLIYNRILVKFTLNVGYRGTFKSIDRGFLEVYGATGLQRNLSAVSNAVSKAQSGFIFNYASFMVTGIVLFWGIYLFQDALSFDFLSVIFVSLITVLFSSLRGSEQEK